MFFVRRDWQDASSLFFNVSFSSVGTIRGARSCMSELESLMWRKSAKQIGRLTRSLVESLVVVKCCFWPWTRGFLGQLNFMQFWVFFLMRGWLNWVRFFWWDTKTVQGHLTSHQNAFNCFLDDKVSGEFLAISSILCVFFFSLKKHLPP